MFLLMAGIFFIVAYVSSFNEEFDKENMKTVWAVVGIIAALTVIFSLMLGRG